MNLQSKTLKMSKKIITYYTDLFFTDIHGNKIWNNRLVFCNLGTVKIWWWSFSSKWFFTILTLLVSRNGYFDVIFFLQMCFSIDYFLNVTKIKKIFKGMHTLSHSSMIYLKCHTKLDTVGVLPASITRGPQFHSLHDLPRR